MRVSAIVACAALLCASTVAVHAQTPEAPTPEQILAERLAAANEAFRVQDYDKTITLLQPIVAEDVLEDVQVRVTVLERLGVSYWFTGSQDAAELTFSSLIKEQPKHELNALIYPPEVIAFFGKVKKLLTDLGVIGTRPGGTRDPVGPKFTLVKTVTKRPLPVIAYLMPFGVGQFANEQPAKGTLMAVLQGVGLALNITGWVVIETMKKDGTNLVSKANSGQAEVMQVLWWVGTSLFAGSYVYSVVDGFAYRLPAEEEQRRRELLDPDDLIETDTGSVELRFGPSAEGFGLGLSGSF